MAALGACRLSAKLINLVLKSSVNYQVTRNAGQSHSRLRVLRELYQRKQNMEPETPSHRNTFLEWNYKAEVYAFSKRLGEEFKDNTLETALTHRSHVTFEEERQRELGLEDMLGSLEDNQHLEEEGIKLMSSTIPKYIRTALPRLPQEAIRALDEYLQSEQNLAHVASNIGAEELILCSEFPVEEKTLASTMRALVGAVVESSGQLKGALFVRDFIIARLSGEEINAFWRPADPLLTLSEILERDGKGAPEPRIISQSGKNTILRSYRVGMYSDKEFVGAGNGETIDTAVEQAALDALWRLWGTTEGKLQFHYSLDMIQVLESNLSNISVHEWSSQKADQNNALTKNLL